MQHLSHEKPVYEAGTGRSALHSFWRNWWGTIITPRTTLRELSRAGLTATSFLAYGVFPLLYSLSTFVLYRSGAVPVLWRPWVNIIPYEDYYLWEALFMIPLSYQLWITFAAIAHLLAKAQHGGGTFESTLGVFAYTYSVPLIVLMWLPDQLQFLVYGLNPRSDLIAIYGCAAGIWMLILSAMGLKMVQGLGMTRSLVSTVAALALSFVPAGLMLIR